MKKITHHTIYLITIFLITGVCFAQTPIKGKVISIADGDTITVLQNSKQYKIRLYGIDTPEKKQDFGQKAKLFTSNMVFNKKVKAIPIDVDRYKRIVGMVYVDGKCLNEELVKVGYAWTYKKYCKKSFCDEWLKLEQAARENKLGLWVYDNPIPPWQYRHGSKVKKKPDYSGPYHGNTNSHVFHAPWCRQFNCKNCTKIFHNKGVAFNAGYRPCGFCKP